MTNEKEILTRIENTCEYIKRYLNISLRIKKRSHGYVIQYMDDIYMNTYSKPKVNRFKFIKRECKKAKSPCLTKVHRSEKYGLVWTDAYVLCTFHDDAFPNELLATEKEKLDVDRALLKNVGNDKANASVEYKDVKARLACLSTKKEKEADIIEIGDSIFKTYLVDKVFKFYGLDKLVMHTVIQKMVMHS